MRPKDGLIRDFFAATSSDSLHQYTRACCAGSANLSKSNVRPLEEIHPQLTRDRTYQIFDDLIPQARC